MSKAEVLTIIASVLGVLLGYTIVVAYDGLQADRVQIQRIEQLLTQQRAIVAALREDRDGLLSTRTYQPLGGQATLDKLRADRLKLRTQSEIAEDQKAQARRLLNWPTKTTP